MSSIVKRQCFSSIQLPRLFFLSPSSRENKHLARCGNILYIKYHIMGLQKLITVLCSIIVRRNVSGQMKLNFLSSFYAYYCSLLDKDQEPVSYSVLIIRQSL